MKRHIVLSGEIGAGKTTLIRHALGEDLKYAGGFATVRVMNGDKLEGFEIVPAAGLLLSEPRGRRFLDFTRGTVFDGYAFRTQGAQLLREAQAKPFAIIDEVGGMELLIGSFYGELVNVLCSDIPWVCVLKTFKSVVTLKKTAATGRDFKSCVIKLRETLLSREDTQEVIVSARGDAVAISALTRWAEEYATQSR